MNKLHMYIEEKQTSIINVGKAIEDNKYVLALKQTFLQLNILLLVLGALTIDSLTFSIIDKVFSQTKLMTILMELYIVAFAFLLPFNFCRSQNKDFNNMVLYYIVPNCLSYILLKESIQNYLLNFAMLFFLLLFISSGIDSLSTWLYDNTLGKLKVPMNLLLYIHSVLVCLLYIVVLFLVFDKVGVIREIFSLDVVNIDNALLVFIVIFLEMLFWYVGINGYGILSPFVLIFAVPNLLSNINNFNLGLELNFVFVPNFWDYFVSLSGSGLVGAVGILSIISRNKGDRQLGKSNIFSMFFSISEPILYGTPIAMNELFLGPFLFGVPLIAVGQYYIFKSNIVAKPFIHVADTPFPLASLISTWDLKAVLLNIVTLIIAILLYYVPYKKNLEKQHEIKEKEKEQDLPFELDF